MVSGGDKYECGTESDEEDLEAPLPLRSDEELRRLDNMHTCGEFIAIKQLLLKMLHYLLIKASFDKLLKDFVLHSMELLKVQGSTARVIRKKKGK